MRDTFMIDSDNRSPAGGLIGCMETVLRHAVEIPTALLVLVEICVLGAGVISRFVFHHPFVWSDELASILFLWLAMLCAVVALQRTEHMRLTAIVSRVSPKWRESPRPSPWAARSRCWAACCACCGAV
jgi:TRAP-type C4-dicarboxylate transport system permease small subunit